MGPRLKTLPRKRRAPGEWEAFKRDQYELYKAYKRVIKPADNVVMFDSPVDRRQFPKHPRQTVSAKPRGLWYGCGIAWIEWVINDMPGWMTEHAYLLTLDKRSMLRLTTAKELLEFTEEYGRTFSTSSVVDPEDVDNVIDWPAVTKQYTGIEICPFQWSLRHALLWYYPWSVASGCIWNPQVIQGIEEIQLVKI